MKSLIAIELQSQRTPDINPAAKIQQKMHIRKSNPKIVTKKRPLRSLFVDYISPKLCNL